MSCAATAWTAFAADGLEGFDLRKRTLILIRHSLPRIEPGVSASSWHLSDEGHARCTALADALSHYGPGAIFCSTEPKARETARIVAGRLAIECHEAQGLHEHDRSNVPHVPQPEFERSVRGFFQEPQRLAFGRETAQQALERFGSAVDGLLVGTPVASVAIVAHGTVISLLVGARTGRDPFDLWQRLGLPSFVVVSLPAWRVEGVVPAIGG
jgi:broad specificity phosphatase PhoE